MDELKKMVLKRIENGRASENRKKNKKTRKPKKGLTLKQRREQEKAEEQHLKSMHKRGQAVTGEMELNMELKKQESSSPLYQPNSPYHPSNSPPEPSNSPHYHPSNSPLDPSPYRTNNITITDSERMRTNVRDFNELQRQKRQKKRNAVQAELADLGSLQVMFAKDAYENAKVENPDELERLAAVYPEQIYGKEAEKIWNDKFGYKANDPKKNPRPMPSVRKTRNAAHSQSKLQGPKPITRKVAPAQSKLQGPKPRTRNAAHAHSEPTQAKPIPRRPKASRRKKQ